MDTPFGGWVIFMVNWRLIVKILGILLQIEAGLMILCQIVAFIYGEGVKAFSLPILLAVVLGCIGMFLGNKAGKTMGFVDNSLCIFAVVFPRNIPHKFCIATYQRKRCA